MLVSYRCSEERRPAVPAAYISTLERVPVIHGPAGAEVRLVRTTQLISCGTTKSPLQSAGISHAKSSTLSNHNVLLLAKRRRLERKPLPPCVYLCARWPSAAG